MVFLGFSWDFPWFDNSFLGTFRWSTFKSFLGFFCGFLCFSRGLLWILWVSYRVSYGWYQVAMVFQCQMSRKSNSIHFWKKKKKTKTWCYTQLVRKTPTSSKPPRCESPCWLQKPWLTCSNEWGKMKKKTTFQQLLAVSRNQKLKNMLVWTLKSVLKNTPAQTSSNNKNTLRPLAAPRWCQLPSSQASPCWRICRRNLFKAWSTSPSSIGPCSFITSEGCPAQTDHSWISKENFLK